MSETCVIPTALIQTIQQERPSEIGTLAEDLTNLHADIAPMILAATTAEERSDVASGTWDLAQNAGYSQHHWKFVVDTVAKTHSSDVKYDLPLGFSSTPAAPALATQPPIVQPLSPYGLPVAGGVPPPRAVVTNGAPPVVATPPSGSMASNPNVETFAIGRRPRLLYDSEATAPNLKANYDDLGKPVELQRVSPLADHFPDWDLLPPNDFVRRTRRGV